jgi:polar amino acid transport system substrate-binding protein
MTPIDASLARTIAPSGVLRAAINFGNPVLAQRDPATGEARGVSVAIAHELSRRLGAPLTLVPFDAAGKVFEALARDAWDVAFLAIDPKRATEIEFTAPYVIIEGGYAVRIDSPLRVVDDVDRPGVRIAVAKDSAYDLYLSRTIRQAEIVRAASGEASLAMFDRDRLDVLAGVKSPLVRLAQSRSDLRVMEGRFMAIEQAMGVPKARAAGAKFLRAMLEELKAAGFVADELAKSGQHDAKVAPPAA